MTAAAKEEKEIAINKGHLLNGIPYITVVGDGGWSKRSYGHTYSASSGVVSFISGVINTYKCRKIVNILLGYLHMNSATFQIIASIKLHIPYISHFFLSCACAQYVEK